MSKIVWRSFSFNLSNKYMKCSVCWVCSEAGGNIPTSLKNTSGATPTAFERCPSRAGWTGQIGKWKCTILHLKNKPKYCIVLLIYSNNLIGQWWRAGRTCFDRQRWAQACLLLLKHNYLIFFIIPRENFDATSINLTCIGIFIEFIFNRFICKMNSAGIKVFIPNRIGR